MKKAIASVCLCFMLTCTALAASSREDLQARIDAAKIVMDQIMGAQDRNIPMNILQQATCVAVVPGMKKGAFVPGMGGAPRSSSAWPEVLSDCSSGDSPLT